MKLIKKLIFIVVFALIVSLSINIRTIVNADSDPKIAYDDTGKSGFMVNSSVEESIYGMDHKILQGSTLTGGVTKNQNVNVFQMKTNGYSSKLVTWAVANSTSTFKRATITEAAADYEKNHPGWIVLGGINADQYWFSYGNKLGQDGSAYYEPAPYYPMVSSGDKLFTVTNYLNSTSVIGFKNDGSSNSFAYSQGAGGFVLKVLDINGEVLSSFPVEGVNKTPSSNGTTVWSPHFSDQILNKQIAQEVTTTNSLYVVGAAEQSFMSMYSGWTYPGAATTDCFFGKGYITDDEVKSISLDGGMFAVETTNADVNNALKKGVRIKVEQEFKNEEMNNVEEAIGFHSCHMINDVDNKTTASYDTQAYSRSLFGRKADGTYVLFTADLISTYNYKGLNWEECNALAAYYDVVEMYQMDGGGSVTAMARQSDGTFKVTNYPKDSGNPLKPREDYSFLFFVARDPGVRNVESDATYHSVSFNKVATQGKGEIKNIKININGKEYPFNEDTLVVDGLDENKEYEAIVKYDIVDGSTTTPAEFNIVVKTKDFSYPSKVYNVQTVGKTYMILKKESSDVSKNISNVVAHVGDMTYTIGSVDSYRVDELIESTDYDVYFEYDIYDEVTKKTFKGTTEVISVTTTDYNLPEINTFVETKKTDDAVTISYGYKDQDKIVTKAYIKCNSDIYELSSKVGTLKITSLDFKNNSYNIVLVLECENSEGITFEITSDEIVYEKEKPAEKPIEDDPDDPAVETPIEKKKCSKKSSSLIISMLSAISVLYIVIRKRH